MKLVLHIVRKDLARLRWWLLAWAAIFALPMLLGARLLGDGLFAIDDSNLHNVIALLNGLIVLVGYITTILLVQEDAIVGTQQFWLTRPISRGRLLAAKTVGALIVVGLIPVLLSLPWWLWCGFGIAQIAHATVELLTLAALVIVAGAFVAALTDSIARALLWSALFVALLLFVAFFFTWSLAKDVRTSHGMAVVVSCAAVAIAAVAGQLALVTAGQFFLRRRGWWLGVAGALVIAVLIGALRWPRPWLPLEPPEHDLDRAAAVRVTLARTEALPETPELRKAGIRWLRSWFAVEGMPADGVLLPVTSRETWRWPDTTIIREADWMMPWERAGFFGLRLAFEPRASYNPDLSIENPFPRSLLARAKQTPPAYEARLRLQLAQREVMCELPLRDGAASPRNPHAWRVRVERVLRAGPVPGDRATLVTTMTFPATLTSILRGVAQSGLPTLRLGPDGEFGGLIVVNRAHGEFMSLNENSRGTSRTVIINGVGIGWAGKQIETSGGYGKTLRPSAEWINGASVVALWLRNDAVFTREVQVPAWQAREIGRATAP